MAPEQATGDAADARSDLFAVGAMLFEMLAGRPAFGGRTVIDVLHATRYEQPPALTGSPAVAAVDRVIRRALAKRPMDRPASADAMAEELQAVRGVEGAETPALAHALTRLVVLPFRVLQPDPETDFLAFSLPDAITTSLSSSGSLILRSSAVAARFGDAPDFKALAAEADVDRVVMGTLLRSGRSAARDGAARRGAGGDAADVAHRAVLDGRSVPSPGRHREPRRRGAVAAARRDAVAAARHAARSGRLRVVPAGERDGADLRRACRRPRAVPAVPGDRSGLRAGVGTPRPLPPGDRQVRRRRAGQRGARRGGVPPRAVAQSAVVDRAQVLRQSRGRHRPGAACSRAAARRGRAPRKRPGALRRARARLPLLRPLRPVDRRACGGAPARSERADQHRPDAADDRRHRSAARHRGTAHSSRAPTMGSG